MTDVHVLPCAEPAPDVIALLKEMLAKAESGELRAVAIAAQTHGNCTGSGYAIGTGDVAHLICGIERLKLRLLQDGDEE